MKDAFYTILVVWLVWRILNSVSTYRAQQNQSKTKTNGYDKSTEGKTTLHQNASSAKKKFSDDEGEYVDFEEMK